jgi:hypothetical protein
MSWINSQVRLGDPLMHPQPRFTDLTPMLYGAGARHLGLVPGVGTPPPAMVEPIEVVGLVGGGGLAVGGIFVKGPAGIAMTVVGGLGAGVSLILVLMRMMSGSGGPAAARSFPPPSPQARPAAPASRSQQIQQFATALAPGAVDILKNLLSPPKPSAPAPTPASAFNPVTSL